ncbi:hypothetical protein KSD_47700 [Ktedonobacter sp. SOSP1-85]|uniref:winged helix-turn-helix domain-containing protein n=1 Tax=Ktedonobacter sp. SOSP1-85 TaxID=2778367 RepID=UPI0019151A79|nr:response regulator transcription factor [Ktedonobacter sp. SOSP1-85]GHO76999.1 hypothetical protein KSD_47700 [Ktedonobacter sp. SOSP1-85]
MICILDAGADDCITSFVGIEEVQARLRALLRSYHSPAFLSATAAPLLILSEDRHIQLDLAEQCVCVQGKTYHLTTKESAILCELMMQSKRVISNVTLLQSVWGPAYHHEIDYLRVYISQLRAKIEETPSQPRYLVTVTRVGYVFNQSCSLFLHGQ